MNEKTNNLVAVIDETLCAGCGCCVSVCPSNAIKMETVAQVDPALCVGCKECASSCPTEAISIKERA